LFSLFLISTYFFLFKKIFLNSLGLLKYAFLLLPLSITCSRPIPVISFLIFFLRVI